MLEITADTARVKVRELCLISSARLNRECVYKIIHRSVCL